jgi:hypothetical protein
MAAIITDQLRILNAKNFVSYASSSSNSFYAFLGLPNPNDISSDWDAAPLAPRDSFEQEDDYWDTMIALKKIRAEDIKQVIRKITWSSGETYDMYRHDISRNRTAKPSGVTSLYSSNYYAINSEYRVYICLQNGSSPENPDGRPSLDEPLFTDLEPRAAGNSGDGYLWKYLYTVKPSDIIKFDTLNFIPVPKDWDVNDEDSAVRNNASTSGQIKVCTITNRGIGIGAPNLVYTNVPISGDGSGAKATIVINSDSKVDSITVTNGGNGYTYGTVDLVAGGVPTGSTTPTFDVIIPPSGGHGADIYRELGAYRVLLYSRIENDNLNPDFITGNQVARIGIVENPQAFNSSSLLTVEKVSALSALKLTGSGYDTATFTPDSRITQTIGAGSTVVGRVISYDKNTGVLKYWQEKSLVGFNTDGTRTTTTPQYGFEQKEFTATPSVGGSLTIVGGSTNLGIDTSFNGDVTTINNRTYYLGQAFTNGISNPEVKKYSGNIIHVDHRPAITRSSAQKEDIKVILQF